MERIAIGSDHGGVGLKKSLVGFLKKKGYAVIDVGPRTTDRCDYPDYAFKVTRLITSGRAARGILICKSGIGMAMAANRVRGVRAVCLVTLRQAEMSRRHNDANVAAFGAGFVSPVRAKRLLSCWLATGFEGGRHTRRVRKLDGRRRPVTRRRGERRR